MKKFLYIIVLSFILFIFPNKIKADCDDLELIKLSKLANNVNVNYFYNKNKNYFEIFVTNLTDDLVLNFNNKEYRYNYDFVIENVKSGDYKFDIYAKDKNCTSDILSSKYLSLPYYNKYYNSKECEGVTNTIYCMKWIKYNLDYNTWIKGIEKYNETNIKEEIKQNENNKQSKKKSIKVILLNIYVKYYYIILPTIIIILELFIYIKNKKDQII